MNSYKVGDLSLRARALAIAALLGLSFGLAGCTGTTGAAGPTGATAAQQATGTIQGRLIDSVSQQPIAGAVIDIGVASTSTNADGQFSMSNIVVPVDAGNANGAYTGSYEVTINLRGVSYPATVTARYPDFAYSTIPVTFTSLYAASASGVSATPVTGLVATVAFSVGKLAATITGVVANNVTKQAVGAGYIVKLLSLGSANSTTGAGTALPTPVPGNVVASTTTDANGNFTFTNVESMQTFTIQAWSTDLTFRTSGTGTAVAAPADGETKTLSVQKNDTVFVVTTDILPPTIIGVTPENNSDNAAVVAGTTSINVVYTFSEAIKQTDLTNPASIVTGSLNALVDVQLVGPKSGNIPHSISWNPTFTALTVTIPNLQVASVYKVDLTPANALLVDTSNLLLDNTTDKRVLNFTTKGSPTPTAPTNLALGAASLNWNSTVVNLDWLPVSGAKGYNVYRAKNIGGVPTSNLGNYVLLGTYPIPSADVSDYKDTLAAPGFTAYSNTTKVSYSYVVKAVSLDNIESDPSAAVTALDTVAPTLAVGPIGANSTFSLSFSEPMDEASVETAANYTMSAGTSGVTPPTLVSAKLAIGSLTSVDFVLSGLPTVGQTITATPAIKDIAGNGASGTATF